jgi:hypothetical protein
LQPPTPDQSTSGATLPPVRATWQRAPSHRS